MGESTLWGGQLGHFHDMCIKSTPSKCVAFNFGSALMFGLYILILTNLYGAHYPFCVGLWPQKIWKLHLCSLHAFSLQVIFPMDFLNYCSLLP